MVSLGIRAEPSKAVFVIYNQDENKIQNIEKILIPSILNKPEQLKYARNCILDILREYKVELAGIRVTESNSKNQNQDRVLLEAIFMESFASSNIKSYFVGRMTSICSKLKITKNEYQETISGKDTLEIKNWPSKPNKEAIEAILVAVAATK